VLGASLQLVDERGLAAITMQAVADRLGVTPMALCRYVTTKRICSTVWWTTAMLGFAASEAGGRFAALSPEQLDADFTRLQDVVAGAILGALAATTP
jgi:AcrR family transcriptional regulator